MCPILPLHSFFKDWRWDPSSNGQLPKVHSACGTRFDFNGFRSAALRSTLKRIAKTLWALCGLVIICNIRAPGIPMPVLNIPDLADRADLIVVGQIISVTQRDI